MLESATCPESGQQDQMVSYAGESPVKFARQDDCNEACGVSAGEKEQGTFPSAAAGLPEQQIPQVLPAAPALTAQGWSGNSLPGVCNDPLLQGWTSLPSSTACMTPTRLTRRHLEVSSMAHADFKAACKPEIPADC